MDQEEIRGAGYVIYENNEGIAIGAHPFGVCTNNEAEYHGVIQGLKKAISLGIENVNVYRLITCN